MPSPVPGPPISPSGASAPTDLDSLGTSRGARVEAVCLTIRESAAVQQARIETFLNGIVLAAEQVQDKRLERLETPPAVTFGDVFWAVVPTLFLESSLVGTVLQEATKALLLPVLRSVASYRASAAVFDQLLSSGSLFRVASEQAAARSITRTLAKQLERARASKFDSQSLALYIPTLEAFVRRGDAKFEQNVAAAAKGLREALNKGLPQPGASLRADDSAGVSVLAPAYDYAAKTRAAIQMSHARMEAMARALPLTDTDLGTLLAIVDPAGLDTDLISLRQSYSRFFEAAIWTRLYGFNPDKRVPWPSGGDFMLFNIPVPLSDYWLARFGSLVHDYKKFALPWDQTPKVEQLMALAEYFFAVAKKQMTAAISG